MPLGRYAITIVASGFETTKVTGIPVEAGVIYTLPIKLKVASANTEIVEVSGCGIRAGYDHHNSNHHPLDSKAVDDIPLNGRDFTSSYMALNPGLSRILARVDTGH